MSRKCCIFAGAGGSPVFMSDAAEVTTLLLSDNWELVYGGSSKGVMGVVCSVAAELGGKITGVLPTRIAKLKHYDPRIRIVEADTMAERKAHFWECDSFVCLPGGVGTLDELFEIWTLTKLGYIKPVKPIVVLNTAGFYDPLIAMINEMIRCGTMTRDRSGMVTFVNSPREVISHINIQPSDNGVLNVSL